MRPRPVPCAVVFLKKHGDVIWIPSIQRLAEQKDAKDTKATRPGAPALPHKKVEALVHMGHAAYKDRCCDSRLSPESLPWLREGGGHRPPSPHAPTF
jgi:hypothetical protein